MDLNNIRENLDLMKLMMNYDSSKTLTENQHKKNILNEGAFYDRFVTAVKKCDYVTGEPTMTDTQLTKLARIVYQNGIGKGGSTNIDAIRKAITDTKNKQNFCRMKRIYNDSFAKRNFTEDMNSEIDGEDFQPLRVAITNIMKVDAQDQKKKNQNNKNQNNKNQGTSNQNFDYRKEVSNFKSNMPCLFDFLKRNEREVINTIFQSKTFNLAYTCLTDENGETAYYYSNGTRLAVKDCQTKVTTSDKPVYYTCKTGNFDDKKGVSLQNSREFWDSWECVTGATGAQEQIVNDKYEYVINGRSYFQRGFKLFTGEIDPSTGTVIATTEKRVMNCSEIEGAAPIVDPDRNPKCYVKKPTPSSNPQTANVSYFYDGSSDCESGQGSSGFSSIENCRNACVTKNQPIVNPKPKPKPKPKVYNFDYNKIMAEIDAKCPKQQPLKEPEEKPIPLDPNQYNTMLGN